MCKYEKPYLKYVAGSKQTKRANIYVLVPNITPSVTPMTSPVSVVTPYIVVTYVDWTIKISVSLYT